MNKRFVKQFLLSSHAIEAHLICPLMIVVLSIDLLSGRAKHDYRLALVFFIVAYPLLLLLSWWSDRSNERAKARYAIDYHSAPEKLRRQRRRWRLVAFAVLLVAAWFCISLGERGWRFDFIPAQYLGYFMLGLCLLGAIGVSIRRGGPLDPRNDPPPSSSLETE
ncbi:MAG TPA: hypothetical protein VMV10_26415 [Pirellulales bacterium]|nr:hypothetical protein [Pirellulales bacterium]